MGRPRARGDRQTNAGKGKLPLFQETSLRVAENDYGNRNVL